MFVYMYTTLSVHICIYECIQTCICLFIHTCKYAYLWACILDCVYM